MTYLFVVVAVGVVAMCTQPTMAQWYCNGRAAVTLPAPNCSGTSVCSPLMQAVAQTMNWWNGTNNTVGNNLGVAARNFFVTFAYTPMLTITNTNGANGQYSTACKKIGAIVAQLNAWANKTQANQTLGNATYVATAKQEMFGTVIPGWGYTIGQYVVCGSDCTNYTSTTSTTTTTPTTTTSTTTTTTTTSTTTTTLTPTVQPLSASAIVVGNGYYTPNVHDKILYLAEERDVILAGQGCSSPYAEQIYLPGLNTPESNFRSNLTEPFVPAQQPSIHSFNYHCSGQSYAIDPAPMCLCSPNGSCYNMNTPNTSTTMLLYSWCSGAAECVIYLGGCGAGITAYFTDVTGGQVVTNCSALRAGGSLEDCGANSANCSYPAVAYINCGPCSSATLELDCAGPLDAACAGTLSLSSNVSSLVVPVSAPGENFIKFTTSLGTIGTCGNCSSPNVTQLFFQKSPNDFISFTCANGSDSTKTDWTGFCFCNFGGCYRYRALPDGSTTLNQVINLAIFVRPTGAYVSVNCRSKNTSVVLENELGNEVFVCDGTYTGIGIPATSLTCSGGCPAVKPMEMFCPGPFVPF